MKKLILFVFIALLIMSLTVSCAKDDTSSPTDTSVQTNSVPEESTAETSSETEGAETDVEEIMFPEIGPPTIELPTNGFTVSTDEACKLHHISYHLIPNVIIDFVIENKGYGETEVYEWLESFSTDKSKVGSATECCDPLNIVLFTEKFGITKDELYDLHFLIDYPEINIELLYSSDQTKIEEYFTDFDELYKIAVKKAHFNYIKDLAYRDCYRFLDSRNMSTEEFYEMSFPRMAWEFAVNRNPQALFILTATEKCTEEFGVSYSFDYKVEYTYLVRCGTDLVRDFSQDELDEMFCGLGRYKNVTVDLVDEPEDNHSCIKHNWVYHVLPPELIEYVGGREALERKFDLHTKFEWDQQEERPCFMLNIKQVIDAFDISMDEFAEICPLVYYPTFDLDILFGGTAEEAEEFYTGDVLARAGGTWVQNFLNLYRIIEEDCVKASDVDVRSLSIPEIVKNFSIKREDLVKMIEESTKHASYDYNLDMLYGEDGEIIFQNTDGMSSNELNEMFCRVGRYAEKMPNE